MWHIKWMRNIWEQNTFGNVLSCRHFTTTNILTSCKVNAIIKYLATRGSICLMMDDLKFPEKESICNFLAKWSIYTKHRHNASLMENIRNTRKNSHRPPNERTCLMRKIQIVPSLVPIMTVNLYVFWIEFPKFLEKSPQRCNKLTTMPRIFGKSHK